MKKLLRVLGAVLGVLVLLGASGFVVATVKMNARLAQKFEPHAIDIPLPFSLDEKELEALRAAQPPATDGKDILAGVDVAAVAKERAIARGKHLVDAVYGCNICHGLNFAGGIMIEDPAIGSIHGPNITLGKGSRSLNYKASDWDHIVRHGVKPDGTPALMPSEDFFKMSDRELSDIVMYIRSQPAIDEESRAMTFGPIGRVLIATGKFPVSAEVLPDHKAAHLIEAPPAGDTTEFGEHLAAICSSCHRSNFAGGPMPFGPPGWPEAANLTPHESGLKGWTFEDFDKVLTQGMRKNGALVRDPMSMIVPAGKAMTLVERKALWTYLGTVPARQKNP